MSTSESSSSFASAPVASIQTRTGTAGRKTLNHRALTIITTPTYRAVEQKPSYFDASEEEEVDSEEEEEIIRANLLKRVDDDRHHYKNARASSSSKYDAAVHITVQFGFIESIRDSLRRAQKSWQRYSQLLPALTIFTMFLILVIFGGSASSNTLANRRPILAPSGRSMRVASEGLRPLWAPSNAVNPSTPSRVEVPPTTVKGRAARAASVTQRSAPPSPPAPIAVEPIPLSPSPIARAVVPSQPKSQPEIQSIPPSGRLSAKFRLTYIFGDAVQIRDYYNLAVPKELETRSAEHDHPDNLAELFNGGQM